MILGVVKFLLAIPIGIGIAFLFIRYGVATFFIGLTLYLLIIILNANVFKK